MNQAVSRAGRPGARRFPSIVSFTLGLLRRIKRQAPIAAAQGKKTRPLEREVQESRLMAARQQLPNLSQHSANIPSIAVPR
jgi:hypothetical protein